jgi:hypothetical protein
MIPKGLDDVLGAGEVGHKLLESRLSGQRVWVVHISTGAPPSGFRRRFCGIMQQAGKPPEGLRHERRALGIAARLSLRGSTHGVRIYGLRFFSNPALFKSSRLFVGSAVFALIVTLCVAGGAFAGVVSMTLAHFCFACAWIVTAIAIAAWEYLEKFQSRTRRWVTTILLWGVTGTGFYFIDRWVDANQAEDPYHGMITAGTAPDVILEACKGSVEDGDALIVMGATSVLTDVLPMDLVSSNGKVFVKADKDKDGSLVISLDVFDRNGNILASINKNEYHINRNGVFYAEHSPKNSLIIFDSQNTKVLDISQINKREIKLSGTLSYSGKSGLGFDESSLWLPNGLRIDGGCLLQTAIDVEMTPGKKGSDTIFYNPTYGPPPKPRH